MGLLKTLLSIFAPKPKRKYGFKPDSLDIRDYMYSTMAKKPVVVPKSVDLRPLMPPVFDQGSIGSCTGNAICGHLVFLEKKARNDSTLLSRLFIYYNERVMEGTVNEDAGALIRDGIKSVGDKGVCAESLMPYDVTKFTNPPSLAAITEAKTRKISSYHRINTLNEMKQCLAEGYPFVFGFSVYEGFESPVVALTGILNMPHPAERVIGGHAVLCVGYDDDNQRIIVRNSWGADWGQAGYFTMPYSYITNKDLASDMWTIRK